MADTKAPSKEQKQQIMNMRRILANAYNFIRTMEYTKASASVTYEQLIDAAINKIEGTKNITPSRPCRLDQIKKIQNDLTQSLDAIKKVPPEGWVWNTDGEVKVEDQANTEEEPAE